MESLSFQPLHPSPPFPSLPSGSRSRNVLRCFLKFSLLPFTWVLTHFWWDKRAFNRRVQIIKCWIRLWCFQHVLTSVLAVLITLTTKDYHKSQYFISLQQTLDSNFCFKKLDALTSPEPQLCVQLRYTVMLCHCLQASSNVALSPTRGGAQKCRRPFFLQNRTSLEEKVSYKVSLCENYQRQSCRAFIGLTIHAKNIGKGRLLLRKILGQTDRVGAQSPIFDPLSFVAPQPYDLSKTSSINTNRKSPTRFPTSLRWSSYVALSPPGGGAQKRKVSKIWTISCDISEPVRDRMSVTINHW